MLIYNILGYDFIVIDIKNNNIKINHKGIKQI